MWENKIFVGPWTNVFLEEAFHAIEKKHHSSFGLKDDIHKKEAVLQE
jgi:hypothetical protein